MNKEQFYTFKSDMKNGMLITKISKKHSKAYYNDGFETQEDQDAAIKKDSEKIQELKNAIKLQNRWGAWVLGDMVHHHWAYYCAKHRLDENQSLEYVTKMYEHMRPENRGWYNAKSMYDNCVKPILDAYEKIVCTD